MLSSLISKLLINMWKNPMTSTNYKFKQNQIFKLVSRPRVIKVSPKSDMSIVWIDIWDYQSRSKAKCLINWCFNVGRYIVTIREANMNLDMLQCKNCWRWEHAIFFLSQNICKNYLIINTILETQSHFNIILI